MRLRNSLAPGAQSIPEAKTHRTISMDTAATPLEPQDLPPKLTALLRMQPDYVLRFTSDGDAPVPVHRLILSLNSSVLRDVLPLAAGGGEGCIRAALAYLTSRRSFVTSKALSCPTRP